MARFYKKINKIKDSMEYARIARFVTNWREVK